MPVPKRFENLLRWLLPPESREHVLGDLYEKYDSPLEYITAGLAVLGPVIVSRIRRTTDFQIFLIETFAIYTSFCAAALSLGQKAFLYQQLGFARLAVPTVVALVGLLLSNAYSDPKIRRPLKLLLRCAASLSLAILGQAVVPLPIILQGSLMSVALVFGIRMLFPPAMGRPKFAPWTEHRLVPVLKGLFLCAAIFVGAAFLGSIMSNPIRLKPRFAVILIAALVATYQARVGR